MENSTLLENYNYYEKLLLEFCIVYTYPYFFSNFHGASRYMENVAPLLKRTYEEINRTGKGFSLLLTTSILNICTVILISSTGMNPMREQTFLISII